MISDWKTSISTKKLLSVIFPKFTIPYFTGVWTSIPIDALAYNSNVSISSDVDCLFGFMGLGKINVSPNIFNAWICPVPVIEPDVILLH